MIQALDIMVLMPEIILLSMACVVLLGDAFLKNRLPQLCYWLSQLTLCAVGLWLYWYGGETTAEAFGGHVIADSVGTLLKLAMVLGSIVVLIHARGCLQAQAIKPGEYFSLMLFSLLGMMVLVSAHSLLVLYLGLELLSLPLYALIALQSQAVRASEAAMKYFVMGAIASGLLLYGMSLLYGVTGSLMMDDIARYGANLSLAFKTPFVLGMVFVLTGVVFKLGGVPFHMWLPDVYEGAATSTVLFLGSIAKIAGFGMALRILHDTVPTLQASSALILSAMAVLSLAIGNVVAVAQTNIKRLLAYSAIAHIGFLLLGLLNGTQQGYAAALFYVLTYALVSIGVFAMIILLSRADFNAERIDDLRGLNKSHPWYALIMMILLLSMAGVPPTIGFYAKLSVLSALIDTGHIGLAVAGVLFSVIGAFYYLRVIKVMYFDTPEKMPMVAGGLSARFALSLNGVAVLGLGLFPGVLFMLCRNALHWVAG